MIKVWCIAWGDSFKVTIQGHAGAEKNAEGHDMVCCAVSTLVQTLSYSLKRLPDVSVRARMEKGDAELEVKKTISCPDSQWELATARTAMFMDGILLLVNQYPECIGYNVPDD